MVWLTQSNTGLTIYDLTLCISLQILFGLSKLWAKELKNLRDLWNFEAGFLDVKSRSWVALESQVANLRFLDKSLSVGSSESSRVSASELGAFTM